MDFELKQATEDDFSTTFDMFKKYMKPVIEATLGWDESYQESGFKSRLKPSWFYWIYSKRSCVGLVCFKTVEESIHIHLLIIFSQNQGLGFGFQVLKHLEFIARKQGVPLTLSCFKNNEPAVCLYKKVGFSVYSEDEYFYNFISNANDIEEPLC